MVTEKGQALKTLWNLPLPRLNIETLRRIALVVAAQAGAALLGLLLVQSRFAGGAFAAAAPLAIAFAAAAQVKHLGAAVLGMAAGGLLLLDWPGNVTAMAVCALAGLCNLGFRKLGVRRSLWVPVSAFGCALTAGTIALAAMPNTPAMAWVFAICGAALAGCAGYFIVVAQGITRQNGRLSVDRRQCAALLLCCGMLLASLGSFALGLFRPAHILAVLFVLTAAYCWREPGGAIAGVCAGAAMVLSGGNPATTAVFALGGLLAGVFSLHQMRRQEPDMPGVMRTVPVAGGFALACVFFVALHGAGQHDTAAAVVFVIECLIAIFVFVMTPARLWSRVRLAVATPGQEQLVPHENEAGLRITQAAGALRRVGEFVSEVSQGLEKLRQPLVQHVYASVEQDLCKQCVEQPYCYSDHGEASRKLFHHAVKRLQQSEALSLEELAALRRQCGLKLPCRQPEQFRTALVRSFDIHAARQSNAAQNTHLRQAAAAQFDTISELMDELGFALASERAFETEAAQAATQVLEDHGYCTQTVCCVRRSGSENAATLTAAVRPQADSSSRHELLRALQRATGIAFGLPQTAPLAGEPGTALLTFAQQPLYQFATGAVQLSSSNSSYCGDYFDCFNDGQGREVLVISDGMGTGGRAAVDSALATEIFSALARSGLSFAGAMRMANQALLLKSCEESLATLDAAGVNLYTGQVEFCKAGGAVSFLRQGGKAQKVELSALPAGILRSINPAVHSAQLSAGDIVVLVSDGMLSGQENWLCEALEIWESDDMQALAEHLAARAVAMRRNESGTAREDDLTVICGILDMKQ